MHPIILFLFLLSNAKNNPAVITPILITRNLWNSPSMKPQQNGVGLKTPKTKVTLGLSLIIALGGTVTNPFMNIHVMNIQRCQETGLQVKIVCHAPLCNP